MPSPASFIRTLQLADPTPDGELLRRFVHGDRDAFELIVWRHSAMVLRLCKSMLRDHHRAEDATQATFLILARKVKTIGDGQTLAAWLHRVAVRVAMRAGSDNRLSLTLEKQPEPSFTASNDVEQREQERLLHEEVDRLSEKYRLPVLLCFFEGLTHAEAAKRLNWPIGTVAGRLSRAKKLLVKRLTDRGVSVGIVALFAGLTVNRLSAVAPSLVAAILKLQRGDAVPATVLYLMNGGLQMMLWTKVKMGLAIMMLCGSVALTTAWAVGTMQQPAEKPEVEPQAKQVEKPELEIIEPEMDDLDKLKKVMDVISRNVADKPNDSVDNYTKRWWETRWINDICDDKGKPILSWRVALLQHLGTREKALFKQFKLNESWDSEHNKKLSSKMPSIYRLKAQSNTSRETYFHVYAIDGSPFARPLAPKKGEGNKGLENTLGVFLSEPATPWTKPDEAVVTKELGLVNFPDFDPITTLDGNIHYLKPGKYQKQLYELTQHTSKGHINWEQIEYTVSELRKENDILAALAEIELNNYLKLLKIESEGANYDVPTAQERAKELKQIIETFRARNKYMRDNLGVRK